MGYYTKDEARRYGFPLYRGVKCKNCKTDIRRLSNGACDFCMKNGKNFKEEQRRQKLETEKYGAEVAAALARARKPKPKGGRKMTIDDLKAMVSKR